MSHHIYSPRADLTADRLREFLSYSPESGCFIWLVRRSSNACAGSFAGSINAKGYVQIRCDGLNYLAHRLAWLYMTGEMPTMEVDHINGVKADNRWANLRLASRSENQHNKGSYRNNSTGFKGVYRDREGCGFRAEISVNRTRMRLGIFKTPVEAYQAYCKAAEKLHGDFANFGSRECMQARGSKA